MALRFTGSSNSMVDSSGSFMGFDMSDDSEISDVEKGPKEPELDKVNEKNFYRSSLWL